mmetsp:Transcript_105289/g.307784  ORF Transcript_105289/g.307784 Transcript_105289/m.307784 type:complete len:346 (-) Transcript_105289:71-1108(-)
MGGAASSAAAASVALALSFALSGCGWTGTTSTTTTTTTTTTLRAATSIWEWREDEPFGVQITYDLSGDMKHSIYGGCWRDFQPDTLGEHAVQNNITFVELAGETGVALFNRRLTRDKRGCLMRKSRVPIDLSQIGRIELDVAASGSGDKAPWYSVWLAPMLYSVADASEKAAEIDLVENYVQAGRGFDVDDVKSNFAKCDPTIPGMQWTAGYCKAVDWGLHATAVGHHVTLAAKEEGTEGRVVEVRHCTQPSSSCTAGDYSSIKVTKPNPTVPDWFPVWNKEKAGARYGHYWLVADLWWTSDTDFKLNVSGVRFFFDNGTEWRMPLIGSDAGSLEGPDLSGMLAV